MRRAGWRALLVVASVGVVIGVFYRTYVESSASARFGGVSLRLEYALTPAHREKGLSGRESIPDDFGMLFVFSESDRHGIWMKDMLVPIDIFWLDEERRVVSFISGAATSTYPDVFYPVIPARFVLETAAGFAEKNRIATGTVLLLQNPLGVSQ